MKKPVAEIPFSTQVNAVVRKNAVYQKRRVCLNGCIIVLPMVFILLLFAIQQAIDSLTDTRDNRCGCMCVSCCRRSGNRLCRPANETSQCDYSIEECKKYDESVCALQFSDPEQAFFCEVENPFIWPPSLTIPEKRYRARRWSPDVVFFTTAEDAEVERELQQRMIRDLDLFALARPNIAGEAESTGEVLGGTGVIFGGSVETENTNYLDSIYVSPGLAVLANNCSDPEVVEAVDLVNTGLAGITSNTLTRTGSLQQEEDFAECAQVTWLSRPTTELNRYLYCSWEESRCNATDEELNTNFESDYKNPDEFGQAIDFKSSTDRKLDADVYIRDWDLIEDEGDTGGPPRLRRVPALMNMISDAWMKYALDDDSYRSYLLGTQELPKVGNKLNLQFSSLLAVLLTNWVIQLLLPLMLVQLVYEKEENLRIMMKMHGLGGAAYWTVNYLYYLTIYVLYIVAFIVAGTLADFVIFTKNSYGVLFIFLILFGNAQIAFAFAISNFFRTTRGCVIFSFLWIFGSGFIGFFLLEQLISNEYSYNYAIELIPPMAAYRGLYEFGEYGFRASYSNTLGLSWGKFSDDNNHMGYVMLILLFEWPLFLLLAWYFEQVVTTGSGVKRHPLFFLEYFRKPKKSQLGAKSSSKEMQLTEAPGNEPGTSQVPMVAGNSELSVDIIGETEDVGAERLRVENFSEEAAAEHSIILKNLRKVFPAAEGVPEKAAVRNLTLAVGKGEVFGLLGPNGAGKTTTINMLIGFLNATSGEASIEGFDIKEDMSTLYTLMGVCPQHDLLWGSLTGFEHMLFYGRLKGLKNSELRTAAEEALKEVNLFHGDVLKLMVKKYSGGMKRRLSVAISFIGNPRVVYLDEPSTGLDPASRRNLWKVVKAAKQDKAIILTTHNMEEAEVLCDRLGIFVDGRLQVIGNPKSLTARYGGYLVFTLITIPSRVDDAANLVKERFPKAIETYQVSGTLKFELPTSDVTPSSVFHFMEQVKKEIQVRDWGVATVTLEEVFIKIAKDSAKSSHSHLSRAINTTQLPSRLPSAK